MTALERTLNRLYMVRAYGFLDVEDVAAIDYAIEALEAIQRFAEDSDD